MRRYGRISVRIDQNLKIELETLASNYAVPSSALCAYILGQWLHHTREVNEARWAVSPQVVPVGTISTANGENGLNS